MPRTSAASRRSVVVQRRLSPSPALQQVPSGQQPLTGLFNPTEQSCGAPTYLLPPSPRASYQLNEPIVSVAQHDMDAALHGFSTASAPENTPEFVQGASKPNYDGALYSNDTLAHSYSSFTPEEWESYFASDEWLNIFAPSPAEKLQETSAATDRRPLEAPIVSPGPPAPLTEMSTPMVALCHALPSLPPYSSLAHAPAPVHEPYYQDVRRPISPDKLSRTSTPWSPKSVVSDDYPSSAWSPGSTGPERTRMSQKEIEQRASAKLGLAWKRLIGALGRFGKDTPKPTKANYLNIASQVLDDAHSELQTLRAQNEVLRTQIDKVRAFALHLRGQHSHPINPSCQPAHIILAFPNGETNISHRC